MPDRYKLLIESMNGVVWESTPDDLKLLYISDNVLQVLGYTVAECITNTFWKDIVFAADWEKVSEFLRQGSNLEKSSIEHRILRADGRVAYVDNHIVQIHNNGSIKSIFGILIDVTIEKQLEQLERLEKEALELNIAPKIDIENVLHFYAVGLEQIFPKMMCSILRIQNGQAFNWASPSLNTPYIEAIEGLKIGLNRGSCGTAAFLGQKVIVSDIANDEKWADFKEIALANNLRACWSQPIINSTGVVMATFAIYYDAVKLPDPAELAIIDRSSSILRVILENRLFAKAIVEMNNMSAQAQELANFGTWQWDFDSNYVKWSDSLFKIFGLDRNLFAPTYEGYLKLVHPDDRPNVKIILDKALANKSDVTYEERIIRPDGSVRYLKSWFRALVNEGGNPVKFIGASLDITQATVSKIKMANIAWQQSHVVRAPLARIMGLVSLLYEGRLSNNDIEKNNLYEAILQSANELDSVIREINDNTIVNA